MSVSVVVPIYNEVENIPLLHSAVTAVMKKLGQPYELILVNDGSRDGSGAALEVLAESDPAVRVIEFRKNYGQTAAMQAGMQAASMNSIVLLDGDLQNDPTDIPMLLAKLDEGFDLVHGWRKNRQDTFINRKLPSKVANWLISRVTGFPVHDLGCTLKAVRTEIAQELQLYGEMHRFIPIYAHMQGGAITEMVVNHRARQFGTSKYGLNRIFKVMLDLLLVKFLAAWSAKPMYVFGGFGLLCLVGSLVPIGAALAFKFSPNEVWQKDFVETPLPVIAAVAILTGFLGLLMGLLAEMLMRTYFESQGKRTYVVKRLVQWRERN